MLALLGILSLLQMGLLPGLIILYALGVRRILQVLLMAMPVSMTANYILFHLLNALGWRDQRTWLIVVGVEMIILLGVAWRHRRTTLQDLVRPDWARVQQWTRENLALNRENRTHVVFILVLGFLVFECFLALALNQVGSRTFSAWDDVVSWGRWATEWAEHGAATTMWWYPQQGPINRAIGYLILGTTEVHLFSKMAMPLFTLLILAILLDLELHFRDRRFLLASAITGFLFWHYAGGARDSSSILSGNMDIPVTAMVLAGMYPLLLLRESPSRNIETAILTAIVAAGAVWTKQTGLFIIPAVAAIWWWQRRKDGLKLPVMTVGIIVASAVLAAASFYVPQAMNIARGADVNNLPALRDLSWRDPWLHSTLLGAIRFYPGLTLLVFCSAGVSCVWGTYRRLTVPLVVLSFLIWGSLFNYATRNYFFIFPILAVATADACLAIRQRGVEHREVKFLRWLQTIPAAALLLLLGTAVAGTLLLPDSFVLDRQRNANLDQVCYEISNGVLMDVANFIAPGKKIATFDDRAVGLPETRGRFVSAFDGPRSRSGFLRRITDPTCGFLFVEALPKVGEGNWIPDDLDLARLIDDARGKGLLKPVVTHLRATLFFYDAAAMLAEYGNGNESRDGIRTTRSIDVQAQSRQYRGAN